MSLCAGFPLCPNMTGEKSLCYLGNRRRLPILGPFLLWVLADLRLERSLSAILRASSGVNSEALPIVTRWVRPPTALPALVLEHVGLLAGRKHTQSEAANLAVEHDIAGRPRFSAIHDSFSSALPLTFICLRNGHFDLGRHRGVTKIANYAETHGKNVARTILYSKAFGHCGNVRKRRKAIP